eukprot:SAG11_NODE_2192_length_3701_cov_5.319367_4_plen_276_part_00
MVVRTIGVALLLVFCEGIPQGEDCNNKLLQACRDTRKSEISGNCMNCGLQNAPGCEAQIDQFCMSDTQDRTELGNCQDRTDWKKYDGVHMRTCSGTNGYNDPTESPLYKRCFDMDGAVQACPQSCRGFCAEDNERTDGVPTLDPFPFDDAGDVDKWKTASLFPIGTTSEERSTVMIQHNWCAISLIAHCLAETPSPYLNASRRRTRYQFVAQSGVIYNISAHPMDDWMEQWKAGRPSEVALLMYLYTNQGGRRIQRGPRPDQHTGTTSIVWRCAL